MLAPFAYEETGVTDQDITFADEKFTADTATNASYQFYDRGPWDLWVGATAKVRDAEIKLEQGAPSARSGNVGIVPLLHLAARYQFNDQRYFAADFDGLAVGTQYRF